MKKIAILSAAIAINILIAVFIFLQLDLSPSESSFMPTIDKPNWKQSKVYKDLLSVSKFSLSEKHKITKDPLYCENRKNFIFSPEFDDTGMPKKEYRTIYSDYSIKNLVKDVMKNTSSLILPEHRLYAKPTSTVGLPLNVTLFYHKVEWYLAYEIDKNWLCPGQRYNHIPSIFTFSYKDMLIEGLKIYHKSYEDRPECFDMWKFIPFTYNLNNTEDCESFFTYLIKEDDWSSVKYIMKQSRNSHNSEGVTILDEETAKYYKRKYNFGLKCSRGGVRQLNLAQKYIQNPLLINGKKFDFRLYFLIASMDPFIVLYSDGVIRHSGEEFGTSIESHLTHPSFVEKMLKKNNSDAETREKVMGEQLWPMDKFENYLVKQNLVQKGWVASYLRPSVKKIIAHLARAFKEHLLPHPGVFEVYGIDFLLEDNFNLWLLEIVKSPSMQPTGRDGGRVKAELIAEVLDIEFALMYGLDIYKFMKKFEPVIDETRPEDPYFGLISNECL